MSDGMKLAWTALVIVVLFAAFGLSMIATADDPCDGQRVRRGIDCGTTYWFNR